MGAPEPQGVIHPASRVLPRRITVTSVTSPAFARQPLVWHSLNCRTVCQTVCLAVRSVSDSFQTVMSDCKSALSCYQTNCLMVIIYLHPAGARKLVSSKPRPNLDDT